MNAPQEIKAVSYVHAGGKLVKFDDLDSETRRQAGTWLKSTYLNTLFQGQAVFRPAEDDHRIERQSI